MTEALGFCATGRLITSSHGRLAVGPAVTFDLGDSAKGLSGVFHDVKIHAIRESGIDRIKMYR
jgi:hypothetical protein